MKQKNPKYSGKNMKKEKFKPQKTLIKIEVNYKLTEK